MATVRALRHHGGGNWRERGSAADMLREVEKGTENLAKHIENVREFGIQAVVAVNRMPGDTDEEVELVRRLAIEAGAANAGINAAFEHGGKGAADLAEMVADAADEAEPTSASCTTTTRRSRPRSRPSRPASTAPTASTTRRRPRRS